MRAAGHVLGTVLGRPPEIGGASYFSDGCVRALEHAAEIFTTLPVVLEEPEAA